MVEKLKEMRRFRNVMVHRYDKVDDIRVYYIVQNRLGDLYEFKEEVLEFLRGISDGTAAVDR